jgi:hypothetical protein
LQACFLSLPTWLLAWSWCCLHSLSASVHIFTESLHVSILYLHVSTLYSQINEVGYLENFDTVFKMVMPPKLNTVLNTVLL